MTGGWRGIEPLEILLCVGLGLPPQTTSLSPIGDKGPPSRGGDGKGKERELFEEFDPDDLPGLDDAVKILFPSLRDVNPARGGCPPRRTEGAEQEYETEMTERLARVRLETCPTGCISYTDSSRLSSMMCHRTRRMLQHTWKTLRGNTRRRQ